MERRKESTEQERGARGLIYARQSTPGRPRPHRAIEPYGAVIGPFSASGYVILKYRASALMTGQIFESSEL